MPPKLSSLRRHGLLFEAFRLLDVKVDSAHPARRFLLIARTEPELSIVPIEGDFERTEGIRTNLISRAL